MTFSSSVSQLLQLFYSVGPWNIFVSLNVAVLVSVVCVFLKYGFWRQAYSKQMPGKGVGFFNVLGHLTEILFPAKERKGMSFNARFLHALTDHTNRFRKKNMFVFWISYVPFVCLMTSESIEEFISGTKNNEKAWSYDALHPWLGTGLLTSHGKKWKSRRKLLTPAFHFDILKDFLPVINEQSQILVNCLNKEISKEFIDIIPLMTYCSLDIICETTLGVSVGAQKNNESQYVISVKRITEIMMQKMINSLYWCDFVFYRTKLGKEFKKHLKIVHSFTRSVIKEKKEKFLRGEYESEKRKRKPLMDLLLEHHINSQDLTEEDIREEVDTFTFEGHDTTSMGMSWALYLIGLYEDVQLKIQEELNGIFGSDVDREVTTDDLNDMKYLDCVLKESQRLYPSVPMMGRNVSEDTDICGYKLIKGSTGNVLIYHLHRDEDIFPDPEKFDPDRFLPENSIGRPPYAYIPFSAGPRNCIGQRLAVMEEKTVIANILRNFNIHSLDDRDKILPEPDLILKPGGPLRIKIRPRY
ncbi:hypothetical protein JTE90_012016 [Oedothorax gibbosus]|uniref:Cytochrome P450 n=1 Tax=Oedothorax gibbosus TaxID=931172 RepID=A0AAV6TYH2_9ARAC|nr:hypothetical protein JTE90_012016 [Oedothorax gibbosus]